MKEDQDSLNSWILSYIRNELIFRKKKIPMDVDSRQKATEKQYKIHTLRTDSENLKQNKWEAKKKKSI